MDVREFLPRLVRNLLPTEPTSSGVDSPDAECSMHDDPTRAASSSHAPRPAANPTIGDAAPAPRDSGDPKLPEPPAVVDARYRLVERLGSGGFGTVFLADELGTGSLLDVDQSPTVLRRVALKLLHRGRSDARRFASEVRALCRLNHPHIVTVYAYGAGVGELPYVAMEFVEGAPLSAFMGGDALQNYERTLRWLIGVADAVGHAHARGVVHRDLKPHNILITREGWPKVVDFGLSWLLAQDDDAGPKSQRCGTPGYLAPELLDGAGLLIDHRVDVYGLGATIFAAFTGLSPFSDASIQRTVERQVRGEFAFPEGFPQALEGLVQRCLSRDPLDRPRTASAVAEALRRAAFAKARVDANGESNASLDAWHSLPARADVRDLTLESVEGFDHPQRGPGVRFAARASAEPDGAALRAFGYAGEAHSRQRRVHDTLTRAWAGAEVSLYGARPVEQSSGARFVNVDADTVPVLEPYLPVSVTAVARVEGVRAGPCATRQLVEMREPAAQNIHIVRGSIAHDMLERMTAAESDAERTFDAAFDAAFARLRWDALAAGLDDAAIQKLRGELLPHFEQIDRWTHPSDRIFSGRAAEARRFSARYGLEGRIDLALVDDDAVRLLELKTGGYESPEHVWQLRAYMLMWDPLAEAAGQGVSGELLYSKRGKRKPLQRRAHHLEREVVLARNDVVLMHRWFSDGDTPYRPPSFGDVPECCDDAPCRFRRDLCRAQTERLGSMSGVGIDDAPVGSAWRDSDPALVRAVRHYYFHFARLIEREYRAASADMGSAFRSARLPERVASLDAMEGVKVVEVDADTVRVRVPRMGLFHRGDELLIHQGDLDEAPSAVGVVRRVEGDVLTLACDGAVLHPSDASPSEDDRWVLERFRPRIGFRELHRALYGFVSTSDPRRLERIVLPHRAGHAGQRGIEGVDIAPVQLEAESASSGRALNDEQQHAIASALEGHDAFLVHGPPGTGKTTVIAELCARLVARGQRVLLAACTNTAVDTMLAKVVRAGVLDVLRVGSVGRANSDLMRALQDAGRPPERHFSRELGADTADLSQLRHRLLDTAVVAATTTRCVSAPILAALERALAESDDAPASAAGPRPIFDVAIIDEASQLTEPLALGAILRARRFVLVGDDRQLPPVVRAADATSAQLGPLPVESLVTAGVGGLDRSLFERLRPWVPNVLLRTQYRMNEGVQAFPNLSYYDQKLRAAPSAAERSLQVDGLEELDEELGRRLDPERPSVWVDVGGEALGRSHPDEADEVVRTAAALVERLGDRFGPDSLGIVAPYRAQCQRIRRGLADALPRPVAEAIEVDTVERFQGREKDAMIVSLVVREWCDFVLDPRRLNVTLTRARTKVIVFGDKAHGRRLAELARQSLER